VFFIYIYSTIVTKVLCIEKTLILCLYLSTVIGNCINAVQIFDISLGLSTLSMHICMLLENNALLVRGFFSPWNGIFHGFSPYIINLAGILLYIECRDALGARSATFYMLMSLKRRVRAARPKSTSKRMSKRKFLE
jgi:hypothetical protein